MRDPYLVTNIAIAAVLWAVILSAVALAVWGVISAVSSRS